MLRNVLILFLATAAQADTAFQKLQKDFQTAKLPDMKQIEGHRSGRCVEANDTDVLRPALFLTKKVQDRKSFTYYRHETAKPDAYDTLSIAQAEGAIANWLKQEQWQSIQVSDGSLVTYYDLAGGIRLERAVRADDQRLVLEVLRSSGAVASPIRYCYFDRVLTGTATPPVDPVDPPVDPVDPPVTPPVDPGVIPAGEYLIGDTLAQPGGLIGLYNPHPERWFSRIRIRNTGGFVRMRNFQIQLTNGVTTSPIDLDLQPKGVSDITVATFPRFGVQSLRATFDQPIKNIRFIGVP